MDMTQSPSEKHIQSTNLFQGKKKNTQLTLEQHRCELHGFTSVWIFFSVTGPMIHVDKSTDAEPQKMEKCHCGGRMNYSMF